MVHATTGTTVLGGYDNLVAIRKVINKHGGNIWLHADGAWGGNCVFSPKLKHKVDGIENVDSFNINAHKGLGLPTLCSLLINMILVIKLYNAVEDLIL
jgi:glutamate/tyrosine decarboxylase-like PLP-dependent enzyme